MDTHTILRNLGISAFNTMQVAMHKTCQNYKNVILLSPTGSGKTLAYLVPTLQRINPEKDMVQCTVILPSRELTIQSEEVLLRMKTGIRSISLYGGRPTMEEHRKLRDIRPQLVFATPGRLLDHLNKGNINPFSITTLVIDEFDKCLELGFLEDMQRITSHLKGVDSCLLTSATDMEEIPAFLKIANPKSARETEKLNFINEGDLSDRLKITKVPSPRKDKLETLGKLLTHLAGAPTIVFVTHRESVERIGNYLQREGFTVSCYHGGMEQDFRERALYKFRSGCTNIMVATDLAARGLDIPETRAIIHYHLPTTEDSFIHRSGRTARWDAEGECFLLLGPEETLPDFAQAEDLLDVESLPIRPTQPIWTTLYIGRGKKDKLSKMDIVGFLCKKGGLKANEIGRIDVNPHFAYAAVSSARMKTLIRNIAGEKIKGMKTLIEEIRK